MRALKFHKHGSKRSAKDDANGLSGYDWYQPTSTEVQERIKEAIAVIGWLPVLDRNLLRVLALTDDERSSTQDLAKAIELDPGLVTSVLSYVNSECFERDFKELSVFQAVAMVGRIATRRMCLEAITYRFFELAPGNANFSRGAMYMHSLAVANVAYATAMRVHAEADVAHLGGLLHDCGKLIMPCAFDPKAMDKISRKYLSGEERSRLEWETFGVDHAQVGAVFALESGVDTDTAAVIAWHHGGPSYKESPSLEAACVQLGDIIVNMMNGSESPGPMLEAALARLKLSYEDISGLATGAIPGANSYEAASLSYHLYRLERAANTDELTGIPNRRCVTKMLREAISEGQPGVVLLCDIDYFKEINDTLGHAIGDAVLVEVAKLLGPYGDVARLGGDEFVIWLPGDGDGQEVANAIVADASQYRVNGLTRQFSLSIGVAPLSDNVSATFAAADQALYAHKVKQHKLLKELAAKEPHDEAADAEIAAEREQLAAVEQAAVEAAGDDADEATEQVEEGPVPRRSRDARTPDSPTATTARGLRGFEVRDEHRAFKVLVLRPLVRDEDLRDKPGAAALPEPPLAGETLGTKAA